MKTKRAAIALLACGLLSVAFANAASAQVFIGPPVVSYYVPPVVVAPPAPVVTSYYAPGVYAQSAVVANYVAPAPAVVSYYTPVVPATYHRGLFGRTIVRTPYYKVKY